MKYFVTDRERDGTCYHEFYKGRWDGKTFWKEDSISLHDNIMFQAKEFIAALVVCVPKYDPSCRLGTFRMHLLHQEPSHLSSASGYILQVLS